MSYTISDRRLLADAVLAIEDFEAIAAQMGGADTRRKIGYVAAIVATEPTPVITYRKGKESEAVAQRGDYIVTNLKPDTREPLTNAEGQPDQYVIRAGRFRDLYEPCDAGEMKSGPIYRAKSVVKAIYFPHGFRIVPPWGGQQQADEGYLFLNGSEVYGCEVEACRQTYEVVEG